MQNELYKLNSSHKLLNYWCNEKVPNGSGLTIPFLIGAKKYLGQSSINILSLFQEFISNDFKNYYSLEMCDLINEYVIKWNDERDLISLKPYTNFGKLYIIDERLGQQNINQLSDYFEALYMEKLSFELYSKEHGLWKMFDLLEKKMIEENS